MIVVTLGHNDVIRSEVMKNILSPCSPELESTNWRLADSPDLCVSNIWNWAGSIQWDLKSLLEVPARVTLGGHICGHMCTGFKTNR